jgi:hypothetical protein
MVDLIGNHLDVFRKNQALIGADVMRTLSSDERDERLKQHLIVSQELHPALLSSEHEYKVRANNFSLHVIHIQQLINMVVRFFKKLWGPLWL